MNPILPKNSPAESSGRAFWRNPVVATALLVLLTLAAYYPTLSAGFIWDDNDYVTENTTLRSLAGLHRIWFDFNATPQYYPIVHTTFWLEYHAWGLSAPGYHLVNVLLHSIAVVLLWRVLIKLRLPAAWPAAAMFALHPVMVESVAWITERKNVLSAVFYFAAALAYLRFNGIGPEQTRRKPAWYGVALVLFATALLTKTVTCTLPAALLLVLWWKKGQLRRGDILPTLPFFVVGGALGLLTARLEAHHVGAHGADWALNFWERCLIAGRAVWFYADKLFWPAKLTFIYPRWTIEAGVWWQWLFPVAAVGVVAGLWAARNRIGRGPLVGVLFFGGTLLPALGFINTYPMRYSFVADHFQYLASIGIIILAAEGLRRLPQPITMALLLVLGSLAWRQTHSYRDLETLWRDTLKRNPACWLAQNNLGDVLVQQGKASEAEPFFRKAVELNPNFAQAWSGLGADLSAQGRTSEGLENFKKALQLQPTYANAWYNQGQALASLGRTAEAVSSFEAALAIKPGDQEIRSTLADAQLAQGKLDEAIALYRQVLSAEPESAACEYKLGLALALQGKTDEAILHYGQTLKLDPANPAAEYNLGYALRVQGRLPEAAVHLNAALRLRPDFPLAHYNLGCVLADQGRTEEARAQLNEALRLKPDYLDARQKLETIGVQKSAQ